MDRLFRFVDGKADVDKKVVYLWRLVLFLGGEHVLGFCAWHENAVYWAILGVHENALARHLARVPSAKRLNSQKAFVVDEFDDESDFVHMRGEHKAFRLAFGFGRPLYAVHIAHRVDRDIADLCELPTDDFANCVLLAGHAVGFGELF